MGMHGAGQLAAMHVCDYSPHFANFPNEPAAVSGMPNRQEETKWPRLADTCLPHCSAR